MGIFGFLKNRKADVQKVEVEEISFGDIGGWVDNKDKDLREGERKIFVKIVERLEDFCISIEEKLGVLEGIDIESMKEHGRAKILVRQGLDNYINCVRVLMKDLDKLDRSDLEGFAREVVVVFNRFEKASAKFYDRANYLIGDEMAEVRNEIRRFYNGLAEMFEGSLLKDLRKVEAVRLKLNEFEAVGNNIREIEKGIGVRDKKIDEAGRKVKRLEVEVEEIRKSKEHVAGLDAREEIKGLRVNLDNEILKLKGLVDFKRLTNVVHSNERELQVVKDYRAHFIHEFSVDEGKRLLDLLASCNMKSGEIVAQVDLIEKKHWVLVKKHEGIGVDYTVGKLEEIRKANEERESIELGNIKSDRRLEELRLRLKGMKNEVVQLVDGFGMRVRE